MKSKIDKLIEKYKESLVSPDFAFGEIQEVISAIQGLPIEEKSKLVELYNEIGQVLLNRGVSVKNYNQSLFIKEIEEWKKTKSVMRPIQDEGALSEVENDFDNKLIAFASCIKGQITNLRRYIILKFGNAEGKDTKVVFLHDEHSNNPFLNAVKNQLQSRCNCEIMKIEAFKTKLSEGNDYSKNNFIALLILSIGSASKEEGANFIDFLPSYFSEVAQINIYDFDNPLQKCGFEKNIVSIKEEIAYLASIDLSNRSLPPEYEKIIKKFFKLHAIHNIEYKELNSGFSDSKVFEIQTFKSGINAVKFVIKIDKKENLKLEDERRNFMEHVIDYDGDYSIEVEETENLKAIRYKYASGDQYIPSVSFSEKLKEGNTNILVQIVKNLFGILLFNRWGKLKEYSTLNISTSYAKHVNFSNIISKIALIEDKKEAEIKKSDLINNFDKIWKRNISVYSKECHGDLHSENFFIDNNGKIFLIDFGKTGKHHALIDYTTLECSIKFRHFPRYIEIEDLMKVEEELLKEGSFASNYVFNSTNRDGLKKYLPVINKIREFSNDYIYESKIEYFISLFLITFKQIQYCGLNQLYALKSAELLSKKIVDELKL